MSEIPITKVQLSQTQDQGHTRAIGSITLGDAFAVHGVRVVETEKGPFVAMPQRKDPDGKYQDIAHPVTAELRARISAAVLEEYQRMRDRGPDRSGHDR